MVRCCVNPACCAELRSLNTGALYAVERRSTDTEFFWLCSNCVSRVALSVDPMGCVSVGPTFDVVGPQPPHRGGYLRLVAQRKLRTPWYGVASPAG